MVLLVISSVVVMAISSLSCLHVTCNSVGVFGYHLIVVSENKLEKDLQTNMFMVISRDISITR